MYPRILENTIKKKINSGKAIVIVGARQVGKTTLINKILNDKDYLFLDADDPTIRSLLLNPNTEQIRTIIANNKILFIDEAQRIKEIGITLKIITDQFKDVQLFVSGSSSFDLGNQLNEPLTGRKWEYVLYTITRKGKIISGTTIQFDELFYSEKDKWITGEYEAFIEWVEAFNVKFKYIGYASYHVGLQVESINE